MPRCSTVVTGGPALPLGVLALPAIARGHYYVARRAGQIARRLAAFAPTWWQALSYGARNDRIRTYADQRRRTAACPDRAGSSAQRPDHAGRIRPRLAAALQPGGQPHPVGAWQFGHAHRACRLDL